MYSVYMAIKLHVYTFINIIIIMVLKQSLSMIIVVNCMYILVILTIDCSLLFTSVTAIVCLAICL